MLPYENSPPVKIGAWRYDSSCSCEVRIVRHNVRYGSGDHEDSEEIAKDQERECYYIIYQTPTGEPRWALGGGFTSLAEAVLHAESLLSPTLVWTNSKVD